MFFKNTEYIVYFGSITAALVQTEKNIRQESVRNNFEEWEKFGFS